MLGKHIAAPKLVAYDDRQYIIDPLQLQAAPSPSRLRADALAVLADPAVRSCPLFLECSKSTQRRDVLDVCFRTIGTLPKSVRATLESLLEQCAAVADEALRLLGREMGVGDGLVQLASCRQHRLRLIRVHGSTAPDAPDAAPMPEHADHSLLSLHVPLEGSDDPALWWCPEGGGRIELPHRPLMLFGTQLELVSGGRLLAARHGSASAHRRVALVFFCEIDGTALLAPLLPPLTPLLPPLAPLTPPLAAPTGAPGAHGCRETVELARRRGDEGAPLSGDEYHLLLLGSVARKLQATSAVEEESLATGGSVLSPTSCLSPVDCCADIGQAAASPRQPASPAEPTEPDADAKEECPLRRATTLMSCAHQQLPTVRLDEASIRAHWALVTTLMHGTAAAPLPPLPSVAGDGMATFWGDAIETYRAWIAGVAAAGEAAPSPPPPREVRWCWLAHMLQPKAYAADTLAALGRVLPHENTTPLGGSAAEGAGAAFDAWWAEHVGGGAPYPAVSPACAARLPTLTLDWLKSLDSESVMRDEVLQQVAGRNVDFASDDAEAARVLLDYRRYVHAAEVMEASGGGLGGAFGASLAPGPLTDLAWHAHMADPLAYNRDQRLRKVYLDHEPCGEMNPAEMVWTDATNHVWEQLFPGAPPPSSGAYLAAGGCCCCCYVAPKPPPPAQTDDIARAMKLLGSGTKGDKEKGAKALLNLALNGNVNANKPAIVAAGGITPLVELLSSGTADAKRDAALVLKELAAHQAAISAAGGIKPLEELARSGTEHAISAQLALKALGCDATLRAIEAAGGGGLFAGSSTTETAESKLRCAFAKFDVDGDGFLTLAELRQVLLRPGGGTPMTDDEIQQFFKRMDVDGDGKIDLNEFSKVLTSGDAKLLQFVDPLAVFDTFEFLTPMLVMPFKHFKKQGRIVKSTKTWRKKALKEGWLVEYVKASGMVVIFISHTWWDRLFTDKTNDPADPYDRGAPDLQADYPDEERRDWRGNEKTYQKPKDLKWRIICAGVEKLIKDKGLKAEDVMLWCDWQSIYQDDKEEKLKGVRSLIKYVTLCDYMLVPTNEDELPTEEETKIMRQFGGSWGKTEFGLHTLPGYGSRGWCRCEYFIFSLAAEMRGTGVPLYAIFRDGSLQQCPEVKILTQVGQMPSQGALSNPADKALVEALEDKMLEAYGKVIVEINCKAGAGGKVNLSYKMLRACHVEALWEAVNKYEVKDLDLGCNQLGDEGAEAIAAMLRTKRSLTALKLYGNTIGEAGMRALGEAIGPCVSDGPGLHANYYRTIKGLDGFTLDCDMYASRG